MLTKRVKVVLRGCLILGLFLGLAGASAWAADIPAAGRPRQFGTMYPDPPYAFRDVRSIVIRFKTAPELLKKLVPEPLVPNKDGAMWLFAGRQKSPSLGDYNEVILGVPARHGDKPGSFIVTMYLDETVPIVVGRERSGWPKKDARIELVEKDGEVTATVVRAGKLLIRASARLDQPMDPAALDKVTPTWFLLKELPSARAGEPPEVLQLVSVTPRNRKTKSAVSARGSLELDGSGTDPLNMIPVLEVTGAALTVVDQDLVGGEILHDYLRAVVVPAATVR